VTVFLALVLSMLKKLWDAFAYYIVVAGVFVGALFYMLLKGRSEGRARLKRQLEAADKKAAEKTDKIIKNIQKAGDAEKDRRLERWFRD
jgi:uncharacterized membrane-anchored protein YhcB (DUF1043 family)